MPTLDIQKSTFYPLETLDDKKNYKPFYRIEEDGTIIAKVLLDIPDPSHREHIICLHYLKHVIRHFYDSMIGVNIISRDSPWDFGLEFSNGEKFNVEITSIADMQKHFAINKNEERYSIWKSEKTIPVHELKKLNKLFHNQKVTEVLKKIYKSNISENDYITNPFYSSEKTIFHSNMPATDVKLSSLLKEVIDKKVSKNHNDKENTVLIVDNRTSIFEISDYQTSASELYEYFESLPFPEIWFYTGYYSDNDGNNAEFSFSPLKLTGKKQKVLEDMTADETGKVVW